MEGMSLIDVFGSYNSWKIDEKTWFINFMNGSQNMYLLEGNDKALLIDTGFGAGNLREYVEKLTDKPIVVVNTHFHPDHSAGNGEFREVHMQEGALIDAPSICGSDIILFDLNKLPYPNYKKIFVEDGFVFELGDRDVEVIITKPAHCNSSIFLLDKKHKMFFTGDEIEAAQVNLFDNSYNPDLVYDVKERIFNFKENMLKVKENQEHICYLLPNHNGFPISLTYVDCFIELVDEIYKGNALIEDKLNHKYIEMDPRADKLCRVRWKDASIFIEKEELLKVYNIA